MKERLVAQWIAEAVGTAFLLAAIVGSGVAAERYAADAAVALLCNAAAIGAALTALIAMFGPVSGAHFNPAVTGVMWLKGDMPAGRAAAYVAAQSLGGVLGVFAAHAMYAEAVLQVGLRDRGGAHAWFAEGVATFGLLAVILFIARARESFVASAVGLYIFSAIWFTSSTAFANPAVTIARSLTDTYTAIRPIDVGGFIAAQLIGAVLALGLARLIPPARD